MAKESPDEPTARMDSEPVDTVGAGRACDQVLAELRPKLHRYCARMTGSVIDGEDVVQEACTKAIEALNQGEALTNPEAWLFRIAHNTALDFLRRRARQNALFSDEDLDMIIDPAAVSDSRQSALASLRTFMRLPVMQRSSVILMDVLGYSLEEIANFTKSTVPSVKAALHRGRAQLRELAREPDDLPLPTLSEQERSRLLTYIERFNARDFDAVRDMLAEDVQLELVNRTRMDGKSEVGRYFGNYSRVQDWRLVPGFVDGRPAVLVCDPAALSPTPLYFVLLEWTEGSVASIRDFRHARYAIDGARIVVGA
jgi:RNA polymerase sigma-70 factor (ECF subfamily)